MPRLIVSTFPPPYPWSLSVSKLPWLLVSFCLKFSYKEVTLVMWTLGVSPARDSLYFFPILFCVGPHPIRCGLHLSGHRTLLIWLFTPSIIQPINSYESSLYSVRDSVIIVPNSTFFMNWYYFLKDTISFQKVGLYLLKSYILSGTLPASRWHLTSLIKWFLTKVAIS